MLYRSIGSRYGVGDNADDEELSTKLVFHSITERSINRYRLNAPYFPAVS